jgi:hypothetical protein
MSAVCDGRGRLRPKLDNASDLACCHSEEGDCSRNLHSMDLRDVVHRRDARRGGLLRPAAKSAGPFMDLRYAAEIHDDGKQDEQSREHSHDDT